MDKVIFDTNAYRYLITKNKTKAENLDRLVNKLKAREKQRGIEAIISPIVAMELIYHVADSQKSSYFKCLKAAGAMYKHCFDDDGSEYRMMASPESIISQTFYKLRLPKTESTNKAIGEILFHISGDPSVHTMRTLRRNILRINNHVNVSEKAFVEGLEGLMKNIDPTIEAWQPHKYNSMERAKLLTEIKSYNTSLVLAKADLLSVAEILISSGNLSIQAVNKTLQANAEDFVDWFPAPIALYKQVLENMAKSEFDLTKKSRSNFLWDIRLMFNIGSHEIGDGNLYFVTDDKAMTAAARSASADSRVFTFAEYMELMGLQADLHK